MEGKNKIKTKLRETEIGKISEEWEELRISEVCDITSSKRIFLREYVKSGVPFYRSKEIILKANNNEIVSPLFITEEKYQEIKTKFGVPQEGDILLTSVGTLGIPYCIGVNERFYFKDGNLTWFKDYKRYLNNRFLLYWLRSPLAKRQIEMIAIGSTQRALTIDALKKMVICIPKYDEQCRIVKILSDLDSKIELHQKINKTLTAIGHAIFKHWFVDFESPHEGKPYKSSGGEMVDSELGEIPKGWNVIENISEICEKINYGYTQSASEKIVGPKFLRVTDINKGDWINWNNVPYCEIADKDLAKYILKKMDIVITRMADPGKIAIFESDMQAVFASYLIRIRFKNPLQAYYLYYLMKSRYYQNYILGASTGTVQKSLNAKGLTNGLSIVIPDEAILRKFNHVIILLREKVNTNLSENKNLSRIRDSFLPRLMSGRSRVSIG